MPGKSHLSLVQRRVEWSGHDDHQCRPSLALCYEPTLHLDTPREEEDLQSFAIRDTRPMIHKTRVGRFTYEPDAFGLLASRWKVLYSLCKRDEALLTQEAFRSQCAGASVCDGAEGQTNGTRTYSVGDE